MLSILNVSPDNWVAHGVKTLKRRMGRMTREVDFCASSDKAIIFRSETILDEIVEIVSLRLRRREGLMCL